MMLQHSHQVTVIKDKQLLFIKINGNIIDKILKINNNALNGYLNIKF